ncbi:MAG: phospho-N-acetylmuramoyl-pentapeptide-transferase [Treponemataceae bacterium]
MFYYFASFLAPIFGPARLLQSYAVLIGLVLYCGFLITVILLPLFYNILPRDRGREFTEHAALSKGKPTGAGAVFISFFAIISAIFVPLDRLQLVIIILTWITMLTGFFDDKSSISWSEYKKALLDLIICVIASFVLFYLQNETEMGNDIFFWFPFISQPLKVHPSIYITISTILLWTSINTTNCTDGVDGLSSTLVLLALILLGMIFYMILGHAQISRYLLIPNISNGAEWAIIIFALAGVLMGYLWHNAFPSKVLMGDAGSRAIGFFIGCVVMISGNPFLIFATSTIIMINGGLGLLKIFLMRFFKIKFLSTIRFPLHDHMRQTLNWSPTQVLIKFLIMQILISLAIMGIFFKVR